MPLYPMPEAFGLHENCNITCAQDEALKLLTGMQSMVSLNSASGEGGSADTATWRAAIGLPHGGA